MGDNPFSREKQQLDPKLLTEWRKRENCKKNRLLRSGIRSEGYFIQRMPLDWITTALKLPRKAPIAVGLAIWWLSGCCKLPAVSLSPSARKRFGITRSACSRGLKALEKAGLVLVQRPRGAAPV